MFVADQSTLSDESEDEGAGESHEEMTYRRKYQMLLERCEVLQQVSIIKHSAPFHCGNVPTTHFLHYFQF